MRLSDITRGLAAAAALGMVATAAGAQSVEEFYSNHDITLVVGAAGGGGADFYARSFVPFWQKHIPGNPDIIIENLPGSGGMKAAIRSQSTAKTDGTELFMVLRSNTYSPLVADTDVGFDPIKADWLGSVAQDIYTVSVMTRAGINSADDLFTKPVVMGATNFANENRVLPALLNEYYGAKMKIITGYEGAAALTLALERGEIDGRMLPVDNLIGYGNEAPMFKEGLIKPVLQTATTSSPVFPDVPNILDYAKDPETIALTRFLLAPMEAGRPFLAPPGLPADRLAALRKAFMDAATDPDYIKAMEEVANTPTPVSGERVEEIIEELAGSSPEVFAKVKALTTPPS